MIAEIQIPTKLSEINLKQYRDFVLLDEQDERKYLLQVLNIFAKGDLQHVEKFSIKKLRKPLEKLLNVLNNEQNKFQPIIEIEGMTFGFHPKLDDLTISEMADLEKFVELGQWDNIHKILAVLYRPIKHQYKKLYQIESYKGVGKRAELFLERFPVDKLHGALVFFWTIASEFIQHTTNYSAQEKKTNKPSKHPQKHNGVGITSSKP